jgi:hypothetical protein
MFYVFFLLVGFFVLGLGLKLVDLLGDGFWVVVFGVCLGFLFGFFVVFDLYSASILLAVVLGSLLSFKVDTLAFKLGFLTLFLVVLYSGGLRVNFPVFVFLSFLAFFDEYGNDWADKSLVQDSLTKFFRYRMLMKTGVLSCVLLSSLPFEYLIAFLLFDLGYEITDKISN